MTLALRSLTTRLVFDINSVVFIVAASCASDGPQTKNCGAKRWFHHYPQIHLVYE
jgi:hypothetical protein